MEKGQADTKKEQKKDWADMERGISSIYTEKPVNLFSQSAPASPNTELQKMKKEVGGFCCFGWKPFTAEVISDRT